MKFRFGGCSSSVPLALLLVFLATRLPQGTLTAQTLKGYQGASEPNTQSEIYGQGVRATDWQSPDSERSGFHLPRGFGIELVASEPEITKPLNMAWDSRGRLWVSCTLEYPFPAEDPSQARDTIRILEDSTGDGRLDRVTVFADHLNIAMGLLPVSDGVICFSIPYIWHLRDIDGDDRVDERHRLLGPFDTTRDTHGMINALRRGSDGWIYACHGFNNQSEVTASDGSSVRLVSGNTFRFREDGSSIEQFTSGQVNPFGMTRDEFGNWYTADCHSKPLTALLQASCYPSFGRPHDGLGFAPAMMDHLHNSTAISGVAYYQDSHFPSAFRGLFYSGNVMTSRLNCNRLVWQGATARAEQLPDFLTSDDAWFRPVDLQLGPDGALYVADFYNKIIGHYEVDLNHPGRDRQSGRIWRIFYDEAPEDIRPDESLPQESVLADSAVRRRLCVEQLASPEVAGEDPRIRSLIATVDDAERPNTRLVAFQVLARRGQLTLPLIAPLVEDVEAATSLNDVRLWTHLLSQSQGWEEELRSSLTPAVRKLLVQCSTSETVASDGDREAVPHLRLAATTWLGRYGDAEDVESLLQVGAITKDVDPAGHHATRIAIRNLLNDERRLLQVYQLLTGDDTPSFLRPLPQEVVAILPGVPSQLAAMVLLRQSVLDDATVEVSQEWLEAAIARIADHPLWPEQVAPQTGADLPPWIDAAEVVRLVAGAPAAAPRQKAARLVALRQGFLAHFDEAPSELERALETMVDEVVSSELRDLASTHGAVWMDGSGREWGTEIRNRQAGTALQVLSSFTLGERYTGTLRSDVLEAPARVAFWLAGHDGPPANARKQANLVRLVDAASGEILHQEFAPRNDTARAVEWDCREIAGQRVRLEVVDGDDGAAYAWIAVGGFSLARLNPLPAGIAEALDSLDTLLAAGAGTHSTELHALLKQLPADSQHRLRLLAGSARGRGQHAQAALIETASQMQCPELVAQDVPGRELAATESIWKLAVELSRRATASQQTELVRTLLGSRVGCELAAKLNRQGMLGAAAFGRVDAQLLPEELNPQDRQLLTKLASSSEGRSGQASAERIARVNWSDVELELGKRAYTQHCAVCHQLGGTGQVIGPQLDGAAARSTTRLAEDILDPHRNVDLAFRQSALLLADERIVSGLVQEQADGSIVLRDQRGEATRYNPEEIVSRRQSTQSLMPDNFGELLDDSQLASLVAFIRQHAKSPTN